MDYAHEQTDRQLKELEKRIQREYRKAKKEIGVKTSKYLSQFESKDREMRNKYKAGLITKKAYNQWRKRQLIQSDQWIEMGKSLSADLTNYDKLAVEMLSDYMPGVYALNHNYSTFRIERKLGIDTQYTLYNKDLVKRLLVENPSLLPETKLKVGKANRWNKKNLNSAILQGVLQGDSISGIAKRLSNVADMNINASVRNARTMITSAENAGRIDSFKRMESMGMKVEKGWMAVVDSRTRHEHRLLDGQFERLDKPFVVNGLKIEYPGDPKAHPRLVYNCRCTLISRINGENIDMESDRVINTGGMSYKDWKKALIKSKGK